VPATPVPVVSEKDEKLAALRTTLLGMKDWEQIPRLVEEILALDPDDGLAWSYKGRLHEKKGELAEALAAYDRAVSSPSRTYYFYFLRARLLRQQGDLPGAIASLEEARKLKPDSVILANFILIYKIQAGRTEEVRALVKTYTLADVQSNKDQWLMGAVALALSDGDAKKAAALRARFRNLVNPEAYQVLVTDAFFEPYKRQFPEVFSDPAQL
jgi:tetratricopeptide (TPR) repeat protein